MSSKQEPCPGTPEELNAALWVAEYAKDVVRQIIETGHPRAEDFMRLCAYLERLEDDIIGGVSFVTRAEEIARLITGDD